MNEYVKTGGTSRNEDSKHNFVLLSHDLRSSLAGVLGSLETIDRAGLPERSQGNLDRAIESSRLLQELLNLAFEMGDDPTGAENSGKPIDPSRELRIIADIWEPQARSAGTEFVRDIPEGLPRLDSSDKVSFHRILNNLIGNATKFSACGKVSVSVIDSGAQTLGIRIADSGPGFSEAALERLFQFRGRPENSTKPGSGLGLYIANSLVRGMGGTIVARNKPAGGAEIILSFPVEQGRNNRDTAEPSKLPDLSSLHILLAEDNITNQLVVTQMLKSMGASFAVASDGVAALALFDREDFDVVLLDIEMPRKSGLEVLREIRGRADHKSATPLVALTAYVMREHRERIERAGADGIIAKPIEGIAALGNSILSFMYGTNPPVGPSQENASTLFSFEGDVGAIDTDVFNTLLDSIGPDMRAEFLKKVAIDLRDMRSKLIEAEVCGDYMAIRAASHTLISVGGSIGGANLQQCAEALNLAVKSDSQINRQSLNMLCIKGISEVLAFLATQ